MKNEIMRLVKEKGHVSFVEISDLFPDETGDMSLAMPGYPSIILWWGMSEKLARAVAKMIDDKMVHPHPTSGLTYLIDGRSTTMPTAKSLRHFKKPHWFPITLHHAEFEEK